ncbi:hypothetical protein ACQKQA_11265 [Pseudomonas sp. NPDC089530]|uniref:hypothetical protein n=1 Tax=Pseudomonas sp. NPDC089530 TaxID=3390651 RepID=UPI003CFCE692
MSAPPLELRHLLPLLLLGLLPLLCTHHAWAATPAKTLVECTLAEPSQQLALLRTASFVDTHVYRLRHGPQTWLLYDTQDDSLGMNVQWQCVATGANTRLLVLSGEFTANYLQGAAFYWEPHGGQVQRIDFAERNRPGWVQMTAQGPRVIFNNVGHESSHRYLIYGPRDAYEELDQLPPDLIRLQLQSH